jgi:hypothetical protein
MYRDASDRCVVMAGIEIFPWTAPMCPGVVRWRGCPPDVEP